MRFSIIRSLLLWIRGVSHHGEENTLHDRPHTLTQTFFIRNFSLAVGRRTVHSVSSLSRGSRQAMTRCIRICNGQSTQDTQRSIRAGHCAVGYSIASTYFHSISTDFHKLSNLFWDRWSHPYNLHELSGLQSGLAGDFCWICGAPGWQLETLRGDPVANHVGLPLGDTSNWSPGNSQRSGLGGFRKVSTWNTGEHYS